jgi:CheY-like chemotaxis protein
VGFTPLGIRLALVGGVLGHQEPRPVLVVDDDDATRAAERVVLHEGGFRVVEARDGAEALWVMQHDPPSVVVLDVQMPGIDGPSFALQLRMGLRRVPLVILTGAPDPRHEADRCNAEAYLAKPFDSSKLVEVVRRFAS